MRSRFFVAIIFVACFTQIQSVIGQNLSLPPSTYVRLNEVKGDPSWEKTLKHIAESTLRIETWNTETNKLEEVGSGVLVEPGNKVLTARHVLQTAASNPKRFKVAVVYPTTDREVHVTFVPPPHIDRDLATVLVDQQPSKGLPIFDFKANKPVDFVVLTGNPYGAEPIFNIGQLMKPLQPGETLVRLTANSVPGMSGGPTVATDLKGEILGVLGVVRGTEGVKVDKDIPGALLTSIAAWDDLNKNIFKLSQVTQPDQMSAEKGANGKWKSEKFNRYWEIQKVQPLLITLHNLKLAVGDDEKKKITEFYELTDRTFDTLIKQGKGNDMAETLKSSGFFARYLEIHNTRVVANMSGYHPPCKGFVITPGAINEIYVQNRDVQKTFQTIDDLMRQARTNDFALVDRLTKLVEWIESSQAVLDWTLSDRKHGADAINTDFLNNRQLPTPAYFTPIDPQLLK